MTAKRATVAVFKAANNWPLYAALGNGMLEEAGISVELVHVSSSKQQMKGLAAGEYDIAHTAADNVIAAHAELGLGAADKKPRIFMGGDDGFISVYSSGKVGCFADLRGRRVGFDSTDSGFAFVMKKILSIEGLGEGAYSEVVAGGTDLRYKAMVEGSIDAAIVTPPHDLLCTTAGFTKLAEAVRYFPKYQGVVGASGPGSPSRSFLRGYGATVLMGLRWLRDRRNKGPAVAMLRENLQVEGDDRLFSALYESMLFRERGGFNALGAVDPEGLQRVAALRKEFSPGAELRPLSEYLIPL